MSSATLYRKYRPQKFSDVIGQQHIVKTLKNSILHDRLGHAYLFTGPRGTGKTTLARLFAKTVNCTDRQDAEPCLKCAQCIAFAENKTLDIIEIDAASNTGVDNIRELKETIRLAPTQAKYKIYIIDEVHMLSIGAFNALLKTLEEPPKHVIFILATTSAHKVPDTILSRCQRFDFSKLPLDQIITKLSTIAAAEKITIEPQALEMIAIASEGGMRDAESLLTQVISMEDKDITAAEVSAILGITQHQTVEQLIGHIAKKDIYQSILLINQTADSGTDLFIFANSLLNYLRQLLLISLDPTLSKHLHAELTTEQNKIITSYTKMLSSSDIIRLIELFQTARKEVRSSAIPQLPLEIAVAKFIADISDTKNDSKPNPPTPPTPPTTPTPPGRMIAQDPPLPKSTPSPRPKTATAIPQETVSSSLSTQLPMTGSKISINLVQQKWNSLIEAVKEANASLAVTLLNCTPVRIEENAAIILGAKFSFHQEKLKVPENRLTVEEAFGTILGEKVRISCIIDETISVPKAQVSDIPSDPVVAQALSILGGKVLS